MSNMQKYDDTGYGPILDALENELSTYIKFSENAFRYFIEALFVNRFVLEIENNKFFNLLLSNAKNTSFSIRLLSTWGQPIEGYALLRIRLEQLIVSSYLLNEKPGIGIEQFVKHYPIIEYNILKANDKNENLKLMLTKIFPVLGNDYDNNINQLQKQIEEDYEIKDGNYKRKWTNLYINQLAEQRDKIVGIGEKVNGIRLLDYYNSVYKISSSIVHSDVASISNNFITSDEHGIMRPQSIYTFTNILMLAYFDIVQCFETAKQLGLNLEDKYIALIDCYLSQVKKDYEL